MSVTLNKKTLRPKCLPLPQGPSQHRDKQNSIFIYEAFISCQQEEPGGLSDRDDNLIPRKLIHFIKVLWEGWFMNMARWKVA